MKLIIGGYAQGKLDYVVKKYNIEDEKVFECALPTKEENEKVNPDGNATFLVSSLHKWIKKLGLVFVNLQPLTPLRGTDIYEKYRPRFIVGEDEYEKWDLAHLVVRPDHISVRRYYWYTMVLYYLITANPVSWWYMVKKYGLHDTLKLTWGAGMVNNQYWKKLIMGERKRR